MKFEGFDWDGGNHAKCQKHGVSIVEVETLFSRPVLIVPDPGHSGTETRLRAIGWTDNGRRVFVVFMIRERNGRLLLRPISARYMHRNEIASYEKENPQLRER